MLEYIAGLVGPGRHREQPDSPFPQHDVEGADLFEVRRPRSVIDYQFAPLKKSSCVLDVILEILNEVERVWSIRKLDDETVTGSPDSGACFAESLAFIRHTDSVSRFHPAGYQATGSSF